MTYTAAQLELAEQHVTDGLRRILDLEAAIEHAEAKGQPTALARRALGVMRETLALMEAHRDEIAAQLGHPPRT